MSVVAIRAERSVAVRADPDRVWRLLLSKAIWSLKARAFMFAVPGDDRLRFWVGSTALDLPGNGLCEVAEDDSARSVTFHEPGPSRHYYRLAVRPARRGTTRVHIEVARYPSRLHAHAVEIATRAGLERWLSGIRAVAENRSPAPSDLISAEVQRLCVQVPRQPKGWISVTEKAAIDVVTHSLRWPYDQIRHRVFSENGQAGVEITWTGPPGPGDASREGIAAYLRVLVRHHQAELEGTAGPAD